MAKMSTPFVPATFRLRQFMHITPPPHSEQTSFASPIFLN
jgi:hypothetical protein